MDCERIRREHIADEYRAGRLSAEDADAYEEHYFSCESCFADLRLLDKIAGQLQGAAGREVFAQEIEAVEAQGAARDRPGRKRLVFRLPPYRQWLPSLRLRPLWAAATVGVAALAVAGIFLQGRLERREAYGSLWSPSPYPYSPVELRGGQESPEFRRGMELYTAGLYRGAAEQLERAIEAGADGPDVQFYLGVSLLLAGEPPRARSALLRAVQQAPSPAPYRWYLALAQLRCRHPDDARTLLQQLVEEGGPFSAEARVLLQRIARLQGRGPGTG